MATVRMTAISFPSYSETGGTTMENRPPIDEITMLYGDDLHTLESMKESKRKYRTVVQAAIAQWVRDFQAGKIKVQSVDDLRTLMELDLRLQRGGS